jgi:hypothetical protein
MADLSLELALDEVEARIAAELPAHVTAFARSHAGGRPPPPAPAVVYAPSTLALARRAIAAGLERGRALWRLGALVAIDADRDVVRLRGGTTWDDLVALAAARDAAARRLFGRGFLDVADEVHGVATRQSIADLPVAGRESPDHTRALLGPLNQRTVGDVYTRLAPTRPTLLFGIEIQPRTFVVRSGVEVIVVLPATDGVAPVRSWSHALHELGHAVAALAGRELTRVEDEAAAFASATRLESAGFVADLWPDIDATTIAIAARRLHARQRAVALRLFAIEAALYGGDPARELAALGVGDRPALALWDDPGAQAAYVAAWGEDRRPRDFSTASK